MRGRDARSPPGVVGTAGLRPRPASPSLCTAEPRGSPRRQEIRKVGRERKIQECLPFNCPMVLNKEFESLAKPLLVVPEPGPQGGGGGEKMTFLFILRQQEVKTLSYGACLIMAAEAELLIISVTDKTTHKGYL